MTDTELATLRECMGAIPEADVQCEDSSARAACLKGAALLADLSGVRD